jgi:hypothetical protein
MITPKFCYRKMPQHVAHTLFLIICVYSLTLSGCAGRPQPFIHVPNDATTLGVQFGTNVAGVVADLALNLLYNATHNTTVTIKVFPANTAINASNLKPNSVVLSFGNTPTRRVLIAQTEIDDVGSEGYIIRSDEINQVLKTHLYFHTFS